MLVKCPKCGFDQPKDTYCAKCGIEMDSFKPVKAPLWKRIVKSPLFSLILFLGMGYASVMYLRNPSQFQPLNSNSGFKRDYLKNETPKSAPTELAQTTPSPSPSPLELPTESLAPPPAVSMESPSATTGRSTNFEEIETTSGAASLTEKVSPIETMTTEEPTTKADTTPNMENYKGPLVLEVRFIEAPVELVHRFQGDAAENAGGDSGEMNYAIVKNASKWINHRSFVELDRLTKKVPAVKQKLQWFNGTTQEPSTGTPFGLNFQVSIQERNGGRLAGELFIYRSLVEMSAEGPMTLRKEFMTHFETDVGSVIGISGIMPHSIIRPEDKDWLQGSFLKVFLSPAYLQNETELLILLQFKGDSK